MRRLIGAVLAVALVLTFTGTAFAARGGGHGGGGGDVSGGGGGGGGGGQLTATLALAPSPYAATGTMTTVSFNATRSVADNSDVMWVFNQCFNASGVQISEEAYPVQWGMWYSLEGFAGPFAAAGSNCHAFATLSPWNEKPLAGAVLDYSVQ